MGCSGEPCCNINNPTTFDGLNGTPIKYGSPGNYERINVTSGTSFHDKLVEWVQTLRWFSRNFGGAWFDELEWLGHAGAYTAKAGCHGQGRAWDLNYVKWNGYTLNIYGGDHDSGDRTRRRRYLAVDACCRRYFKYTLDGWYNSSHENHIHMDNDQTPHLDRDSESDTKFVQAVCNNFNGAGLVINGDWNQATGNAWQDINNEWGYPDICDPAWNEGHWGEWCNQVMRHGFSDSTAGTYNSPCGEPS